MFSASGSLSFFALRSPPVFARAAMPSRRHGRGSLGVRAQDAMTVAERLVMLGRAPATSTSPAAGPSATTSAVVVPRVTPPAAAAKSATRSPVVSTSSSSHCAPLPPAGSGRSMAKRADAPSLKPTKRGNAKGAVAALHEHGLDALVDELYADRSAKSSVGIKESHMAR